MSPLGDYEQELLFRCCLGLISVKEAATVEARIAHKEQASDVYMRILIVLAPLASLDPERCPEGLAERATRNLSMVAQGMEAVCAQATYSSLRTLEECRRCLSNNILMKSLS